MGGVISQKVSYDNKFSKPLIWESCKKGVLKYKYTCVYNENGKVLNTKSYKGKNEGKISFEEIYVYNGDQLVTVENRSNGKLLRSFAISYI